MKAYKCDRCGELFEKQHLTVLDELAAGINKIVRKDRFRFVVCDIKENVDLCPDCTASLIKWLGGNEE